jgi:hypothetical protein
MLFKIFQENQ